MHVNTANLVPTSVYYLLRALLIYSSLYTKRR